jgi:hypothetical protein
MKIGDLIKVVPSNQVSGYAPSYVRIHYNQVGMILDFKVLGGITYYITLINEQKYMISDWNVRLLSNDKT